MLDVDGVLVDVEGSFREGVLVTVERALTELGAVRPWRPEMAAVRLLKRAGGFNDDVDTAIALCAIGLAGREADVEEIAQGVEAAGGGLPGLRTAAPELPRVSGRLILRIFDEHYWGADAFRVRFGEEPEHHPSPHGLRARERPLVEPGLLGELRAAGVEQVAVISGRTPRELDAALELLGWARHDLAAAVTGDMVRKPDPAALDLVVEATGGRRLCFAGDVRDDWDLVRRHRARRGDAVEVLGVIVGPEAAAMRGLGCDATLPAAGALPALLAHLAGARDDLHVNEELGEDPVDDEVGHQEDGEGGDGGDVEGAGHGAQPGEGADQRP